MHDVAENAALSAELARYHTYVDRREREALVEDVANLRTEVLRLTDSVKRLSGDPKVRPWWSQSSICTP